MAGPYDQHVEFESVSNVTATNSVEVGRERKVGDESYVYVYNTGGEDISPGQGAIVSGVTGYSVTVSSVTSADFLVGVCKHATLTTATYGWLMTRGFSSVEMLAASGTVAKGGLIELGADGLFAPVSNTTGNGPAVGKAMEEIVTGASGQAFINVR